MLAVDSEALQRFNELFVVLEDLIKRVADTEDPNIRCIRARVRADLLDLTNDPAPLFAVLARPSRSLSSSCRRRIGVF
jgi:hypothetical protein